MSVIFLLLPVAILLVAGFVALFVWAARDGQFDDVRTPQLRMLIDDEAPPKGMAETRKGRSQESP